MNKPAITVFMAVYNGSAYLAEAIDSVLAQTFKDFELLIIDDGSTDNSTDIIRAYYDPRIRLLHNEENKQLAYTRNRGVEEAKGEYFAILDCDDVALPERLSLQYNYMKNFPEVAICGGRAVFIDKEGKSTGLSKSYPGNKKVQMVFENIFINSSVMIQTDVIKSLRYGQDYQQAGDYDLATRIADQYPVAILDDVLVKYRTHGDNISVKGLHLMRLEEKKIIKNMQHQLGISDNPKLVEIHHSYYTDTVDHFSLAEHYSLFKALKEGNEQCRKYDQTDFSRLLFDKWYDLIRRFAGKNALFLFFKKPLFDPSLITFKQIRKVFKQSLKHCLALPSGNSKLR